MSEKKICNECLAINVAMADKCHNCSNTGFAWWVSREFPPHRDLQSQLQVSEARLAEANRKLIVARKALEFYADSDNYEFVYEEMGEINGVPQGGDIERLIDIDDCELLEENDGSYYGPAGRRAREALKEIKDGIS